MSRECEYIRICTHKYILNKINILTGYKLVSVAINLAILQN